MASSAISAHTAWLRFLVVLNIALTVLLTLSVWFNLPFAVVAFGMYVVLGVFVTHMKLSQGTKTWDALYRHKQRWSDLWGNVGAMFVVLCFCYSLSTVLAMAINSGFVMLTHLCGLAIFLFAVSQLTVLIKH